MTDKIGAQIDMTVDASGVKAGTDQVVKSIASIGVIAEYVGNKADASLGKIGKSAEMSGKQVAAATRSISAQADRALASFDAGGSIASRLEINAKRAGANLEKLADKIAMVRAAENAAAASSSAEAEAASIAKRAEAFERLRQTVAKLNYERAKAVESEKVSASLAQSKSNDAYIASLEKTVNSIGKTRSELVAMELAQRGLTARGAPLVAKLAELDEKTGQFGKSAFATRNRLLTLQYTISDIAASAASGISPLTILLQQGGQVFDAFGGANAGKGNFFKNLLATITEVLTPFRLAVIASVGAIVSLGAAISSVESKMRGLAAIQAQFAATGRGDLFSTDELNEFIQRLALVPGVTRDSATQIVSELSKVHDIGGPLLRDLAGITADYAKATGTDIPTAAKALAGAFGNVEAGAKQIDSALGRVSTTTLLAVERLVRANDVVGAQRVLFDSLASNIRGLAENALTPLQKAANDFGNAWEKAGQSLGNTAGIIAATASIAGLIDKLSAVINFLPEFEKKWSASFSGGLNGAVVGFAKRMFGPGNTGGATGSFDAPPAAGAVGGSQADDEIKRSLEAAKGFQSQASQIASLLVQRKAFESSLKKSIELYKDNSEQANRLRAAIAGVDEKIKEVRNRGGAASEADAQRRANLAKDLAFFKDQLSQEQDALRFNQQFAQGQYQSSLISLDDYYAQRRKITAEGVKDELEAQSNTQARIQQELDRGQFKDPHQRTELETQLANSRAEAAKIQTRASYELALATQEQTAAQVQLNERVQEYRAQLFQLSGDEEQAAKIRTDIAIANARRFATTAGGQVSQEDLAGQERQLRIADQFGILLTRNTQLTNAASSAERAYLLVAEQRGDSLREIESNLFSIRAKAAVQLGEQARAAKALADLNPSNIEYQQRAVDLAQQYAEALNSVDPALTRLRESAKSTADAITNDIANAINDFKGFRPLLDAIGQDLLKAGTDLLITQPLKVSLEGLFKDVATGDNPLGNLLKGVTGAKGASSVSDAASKVASLTADTTAETARLTAVTASTAAESAKTAALTAGTAAEISQNAAVTASTTALISLAEAAASASAALSTQSASSGGGGILGGLAGLISGGSSGGVDYGQYFHAGGIVGLGGETRAVRSGTFVGARRMHSGGIPGLMSGEIPAILRGGPKGQREEVLTASDPRHSDNGGRRMAYAPTFNIPANVDRRSMAQIEAAAYAGAQRAWARNS
jgi:hypothetical protein